MSLEDAVHSAEKPKNTIAIERNDFWPLYGIWNYINRIDKKAISGELDDESILLFGAMARQAGLTGLNIVYGAGLYIAIHYASLLLK